MMIDASLSALTPSQYRKFVKGWDKTRYADLFSKYNGDRNAYRIYIPVQKGSGGQLKYANAPKEVVEALNAKGYSVEDYITGIAVDSSGKRRMKMGKLLSPELQKVVANDPVRQGAKAAASGDQVIVISRHPYDVAGMSTDRGWISCMNIVSGSNKHYVEKDVRDGSIIAYLTNKNDLNIKNPSARALMRVYQTEDGKTGLFPSGTYGNGGPRFVNTLKRWCSEVNSTYFHIPFGTTMTLLASLYPDAGSPAIIDHYDHDADKDLETLREAMVAEPSEFPVLYGNYSLRYKTVEDNAAVFDMILNSGNPEWIDHAEGSATAWLHSIFNQPYADNNAPVIRSLTQVAKSAARITVSSASRHEVTKGHNVSTMFPAFVLMSDLWQERAALTYEEAIEAMRYINVSPPRILSMVTGLLRDMPTATLINSYSRADVTDDGAARSVLRNPLWYKLDIKDTALGKAIKKYLAGDKKRNPDEYTITRDGVPVAVAQLSAEAKMPALFKAHMDGLRVSEYQATDTDWRDAMTVILDRMPDDKWPSAIRGAVNPMPLFSHGAQYKASPAGQAALGKVVANYVKYGSMRNAHHIVLPYLDQHYGNGLITADLLAQVDPKMAMRAVGSMYLSRMMGGPDGNREATIDLNVENYIASIPMLYVACSDFTYTNTETCVRYCEQLAKVDRNDIKKLIDSIYAILALRAHTAERLLTQCPFYVFALWAADYVEEAHPVDIERSWNKPELRSALDLLSRNGREFA